MVNLNIDLPESFFLEEERDGYLVSAKTKELWAVELDLLNEFDRVCKKHNLKYFLDAGSLLGAVRHKGFIPWDDDLDVSMLREDYEKLLEVASKEFKEPYFLQNHHTEKHYSDAGVKLRRSDTAFLLAVTLSRKRMNQGVFLDIFVFDSLPTDDVDQFNEMMCFAKTQHYRIQAMAEVPRIKDGLKMVLRYVYYNLRYGSIYKQYDILEQVAKSNCVGPYKVSLLNPVNCRYPESWFKETIDMPFEVLMVPVPVKYDEILKAHYGDYMIPVKGGSMHELVYFDADRSYRDVRMIKHR